MNNKVNFEEDWGNQNDTKDYGNSKLADFLINFSGGYIRDSKQANLIILIFFIISLSVSIIFTLDLNKGGVPSTPVEYGPPVEYLDL